MDDPLYNLIISYTLFSHLLSLSLISVDVSHGWAIVYEIQVECKVHLWKTISFSHSTVNDSQKYTGLSSYLKQEKIMCGLYDFGPNEITKVLLLDFCTETHYYPETFTVYETGELEPFESLRSSVWKPKADLWYFNWCRGNKVLKEMEEDPACPLPIHHRYSNRQFLLNQNI